MTAPSSRVLMSVGAALLLLGLLIIAPTAESESAAALLQQQAVWSAPTEPISGSPHVSFTDDSRPVITYADFDPSGPFFDHDGNRIPHPAGPRMRVLICGDVACEGPAASDVGMPVQAEGAFGAVDDGIAVVAATNPTGPILVRCDAATCTGAATVINLAIETDTVASVIGLRVGPNGTLYVLLGAARDGNDKTWLFSCSTVRCDDSAVIEYPGAATGLQLNRQGHPLVAIARTDGNIGVLNCADNRCVGDLVAQTDLLGVAALVADGADGPIVAYIDSSADGGGVLRLAHCDDRSCAGDEQAASVIIAGDGENGVDRLFDLEIAVNGAPVVAFGWSGDPGTVSPAQLIVSRCMRAACGGGGDTNSLGHFDSRTKHINMALSPTGVLHTVSDQLTRTTEDGVLDYAQMKVVHYSCGDECQCNRSLCGPQDLRDVCGTGRADVAIEIALAIAGGEFNLVDLASGQSPTSGRDVILGTPLDDDLVVEAGDTVCGGDGDDTITFTAPVGEAARSTAFGGQGNDVINMSAVVGATVWGDRGDDTIIGSAGDDGIYGESGTNRIWGGPGDDFIQGAGGDRIRGGPGNDQIQGGTDVNGSSGDDLIYGTGGPDTLRGGTGNDEIYAREGDDILVSGNGGEDLVLGGPGDDQLVTGGPRPDDVQGGEGNDLVKGNGGADVLSGGPGDDEVRGGPQPDKIFGGLGTDDCFGGPQDDEFTACESMTQ